MLLHPNIIRVIDVGESEIGDPFVVMELLSGETLTEAMSRGPLLPVKAVQLLLPVADALRLAHSRGVVHRDLKPDNIFLAVDGGSTLPKLLDFGIAQVAGCAPDNDLEGGASLLGSPPYMSPEQVRGEETDLRTDVWSFCVVLYEALSGRRPFSSEGCGCSRLLRSILSDEPRALELCANVDPRLSKIVQRGMAKIREERYASIDELAQLLATWVADQSAPEDASRQAPAETWWPQLRALPAANASQSKHCDEQERTLASRASPELGAVWRRCSNRLMDLRAGRRPLARATAALLSLAEAGLSWCTLALSSSGRAETTPTALKPLHAGKGELAHEALTLVSAPAESDSSRGASLMHVLRQRVAPLQRYTPCLRHLSCLFRADEGDLKAHLPGVAEKDLQVQLCGDRLSISGKRESEKTEQNETHYTTELSYSSFMRSFTLPEDVDTDKAHAELKNRVPGVSVPNRPCAFH